MVGIFEARVFIGQRFWRVGSLALFVYMKGAEKMIHSFSRTELLTGRGGLLALAAAKVAVFGIGGVGSYAAEALARSGIGAISLIDHDRIDETNINRQLHALQSTVGLYKVDVMGERIKDINPECRVEARREFFEFKRAAEFLESGHDYIIDAIDSVDAKIGLICGSLQRGIAIVSAMGAANKLDPTGFGVVDISETYNDPLARVVRKRLRDAGISTGLKVVFSPELPRRVQGKSEYEKKYGRMGGPGPQGTIAFVPAAAGLVLAGVVVRDLLANCGVTGGCQE